MRNAKELDVNVATRRIKAREWARSNGEMQGIVLPNPQWWHKYFKWEHLTVAGRNIEKGFVVTPTIAAVLLASLIGGLGWYYKSSTADSRETRDAVIRMETLLNERTRTFESDQAEIKAQLQNEVKLGSMYREMQVKKDLDLKWALRQKGIVLDQ